MFFQSKHLMSFAMTAVLIVSAAVPASAQSGAIQVGPRVQEFMVGLAQGTFSEAEAIARLESLTTEERLEFAQAGLQRTEQIEAEVQSLENTREGFERLHNISLVVMTGTPIAMMTYVASGLRPPKSDRAVVVTTLTALSVMVLGIYGFWSNGLKMEATAQDKKVLLTELRRTKEALAAAVVNLENKAKIGE